MRLCHEEGHGSLKAVPLASGSSKKPRMIGTSTEKDQRGRILL